MKYLLIAALLLLFSVPDLQARCHGKGHAGRRVSIHVREHSLLKGKLFQRLRGESCASPEKVAMPKKGK